MHMNIHSDSIIIQCQIFVHFPLLSNWGFVHDAQNGDFV